MGYNILIALVFVICFELLIFMLKLNREKTMIGFLVGYVIIMMFEISDVKRVCKNQIEINQSKVLN